MNSTAIFIADDRLRPIWRFFLSVMLLFAVLVFTAATLRTIFLILKVQPSEYVAAFWQFLMGLVAIIAAFKLMTAVFEGRPLGSVGLAFHPRWGRELGRGLAVGGAMLFVTIMLEWVCGFAHFTFTPHPMLRAGSFTFVFFALAAAFEEATFRGYPFQRLAESITPAGAIAATSALFGLAHLGNPHRTWISTLNTALVGIPFCIAYLRTRALWMPIGMHFIWNFLMGFFLGLPVSGLIIPASTLTARVRGPIWLTGGPYGPEGGLLAMGAILVGIVYLSFTKSIYTTEEMKALVFAPVTSPWPDRPITIFSVPPGEETKRD
ncbi:MAG TPA: type II CAAX endopeptidase family protein [Terriglobia bacterium]|nr:type II CAAX endopeptidase family protein [Terriglobia bacterium]